MGQAIGGHLELLYPSEYLKAADLRGREITVTLDHAEWEALAMAGRSKKDNKVVFHVRNAAGTKLLGKRWVVGKTVLRQIADALGSKNVEDWNGKKVTVYPTTCRGKEGKTVECIRVKLRTSRDVEDPTPEMMAEPEPRVDFADEAEAEEAAS